MRYLIDTNIISDFMKPVPSESLIAWMAEQIDDDLFISSLTLAEIRRGVLEKPAGKRRDQLDAWFVGPTGPRALFDGRILSFDEKAALSWAKLMADAKAKGRPRSGLDTIIAAVAEANGCVVVTDNEKDFEGIEILNPLRSSRTEEADR
ncbi:type II toxin-antitoxin system VapC family toxin [Mesorhizobium sp. M0060]|uniref:type II toxin-antitoxin system VapC family toxin n=1 Tax=Mesorhizobium sp. M0060 TaxID=2956866 RepID=UPI003337B5B9